MALAVFLFATAASGATSCIHSFDAPRTAGFTVNSALAVADFDGDGRGDLLTAAEVYLNFSLRVPLPVALANNLPRRVTDVNRDGRPDVVGIRNTDILALVNNGDGTFTAKTTPHPPFGQSSTSSALADFNHDGLLDVFVIGAPVYLANGDGTFQQENSTPFSGQGNWIAADVDGDHLADLIAAPPTLGPLTFFHRQPNGFDTGQVWTTTSASIPLLAADFDLDGREDILLPGQIVFGAGNAAPTRSVEAPTGSGGAVFAADFNGDGAPDLLVRQNSMIEVRLNDGHGNVQTVGWQLPNSAGLPGEIDGDGIIDLVVFAGGEPVVLHGNGDGTFRVPRVALAPAAEGVSGDFDGDGDDDLALPKAMGWNNGDNTFRVAPLAAAHPFAAADIDGDGIADVVTIEPGGIRALRVRPDGSMAEVGRVNVTYFVDAAVGDFSGAHRPELAVLLNDAPRLQVFDFHNDAAPRFTANPSGPGNSLSVAAADLNGDGADDIVVTGGTLIPSSFVYEGPRDSQNGHVSTFVSTGASFEAERVTRYAEGDSARTSALYNAVTGDIDGDGKTDVAAATLPTGELFNGFGRAGGRLIVFFGDGRGAFDRTREANLPVQMAYVLVAADLDGDARTDLALNGAFRLYLGKPGGFAEQPHYLAPTGSSPALPVRPRPGALPSLVVPILDHPDAMIYRPICMPARSRPARH